MSLEQQIEGMFQEVLRLETVRPTESFFVAGGDSLRAAHLMVLVYARFGADVSLEDFLARPTAAGLAELVLARLVESSPAGEEILCDVATSNDETPIEATRGAA